MNYLQLRSDLIQRSKQITTLQRELADKKETNNTRLNNAMDSVNLEEVRKKDVYKRQLFIKAVMLFNEDNQNKIRVIGLVRDFEKARRIFGDLFTNSELFWVQSDLVEFTDIEFDVDYIIHTASVTTSKLFVTNPVETIETMYCGTKNILELAREKKCKSVVYLSSMEMYGVPDAGLPKVQEKDLRCV